MNPRYLYRKLFGGDDTRIERFLATVCTQPWNEQHDRGLPFSVSIAELCSRHPEHGDMIRAYHGRWPEMLTGRSKALSKCSPNSRTVIVGCSR